MDWSVEDQEDAVAEEESSPEQGGQEDNSREHVGRKSTTSDSRATADTPDSAEGSKDNCEDQEDSVPEEGSSSLSEVEDPAKDHGNNTEDSTQTTKNSGQ